MDLLEQIHRTDRKMIRGLEHLSFEERLKELGLFKPGEGKAAGRSYCSLSEIKGGLQDR